MRADTQHTARGYETRGVGEGRTKQWGTETGEVFGITWLGFEPTTSQS